jgi:hypothetical protein
MRLEEQESCAASTTAVLFYTASMNEFGRMLAGLGLLFLLLGGLILLLGKPAFLLAACPETSLTAEKIRLSISRWLVPSCSALYFRWSSTCFRVFGDKLTFCESHGIRIRPTVGLRF